MVAGLGYSEGAMRRALLLLALVCCGREHPSSTRSNAATPSHRCDEVGTKPRTGDADPAARGRGLRDACVFDSWPQPTIDCFVRSSDDKTEQTCARDLDPARQDWLRYRIGRAENRIAGWSCAELERIVGEAGRCKRVPSRDRDPLPEVRVALTDIASVLRGGPRDDARRTLELRCLSLQRIVTAHVAASPCQE